MLAVVEDDDVLTALEDDVEVAAVDGLLRPPPVDDTPLLADQLDRQAIDETRCAVGMRLDERCSRLV